MEINENKMKTKLITKDTVFGAKTTILKKPYYVEASFYTKFQKHVQSGSKKIFETKSRRSTIIPDFIGYTIGVHNGKAYKQVLITDQMIGRKLGEFSLTRTFKAHPPLKGSKKGDNKK